MQRRHFLQQVVTTGVSLPLLGGVSVAAEPAQRQPLTAGPESGRLLAVGFGSKRQSGQPASGSSQISEITLADWSVKQAWIPMPNAHSLVPTGGGEFFCIPLDGPEAVFVDRGLKERGRLVGPADFLFSGHALLHPTGELLFVSLRKREAHRFSDTGRIAVVDVRSRKVLQFFDSGGVRPHDLVWLDGGKILAISHYGDINYTAAGMTSKNQRDPRLVLMQAADGKIVRSIVSPASGSLTHIAADGKDLICGVPLNYFGFDELGKRATEQALDAPSFEISVAEELEGRIAAPMPILLFELGSGKVTAVLKDLGKQRRAQSVAYHRGSEQFLITYPFSDVLACVRGDHVTYVSGFDLGLSFVRGVCALGDSEFIAVSGQFRGVAIVRAADLVVVKRFDVALFDCPHLVFAS